MMHSFLSSNRDELIARCKRKVAMRPHRDATEAQLSNGIPRFLDQLTRTLLADEEGQADESLRISGESGGDTLLVSEMGVSAALHGKELMALGFTVDQVVHDYGDLCQAITDLAVERDAPFAVNEFRTLNRCLDNAIADAVLKFSLERDARQSVEFNERIASLVHELRNSLGTAVLAVAALEAGSLPMSGATGGVLKRTLRSMTRYTNGAVEEVRRAATPSQEAATFSIADFIADAKDTAALHAAARDCSLIVPKVDPLLGSRGQRAPLLAALGNLLQNAFKFTQPRTSVTLQAYAVHDHVVIDVSDHCGGLPPGNADKLFRPFLQGTADRSGLGLGLSIARETVEANAGVLTVRNVPGTGCVFTMCLPLHSLR